MFILAAAFLAALDPAALAKEATRCAAIKNSSERLECFDKIAGTPRSEPTAAPAPPSTTGSTGAWEVETRTDPLEDKRIVSFTLVADTRDARLVVRCMEGRSPEVYIKWDRYLSTENVEVTTRLGSEKPVTKYWSIATDNEGAFLPRGEKGFIRSMMSQDRLIAKVTPYGENPVTSAFTLTGLSKIIAFHQNTVCGMD